MAVPLCAGTAVACRQSRGVEALLGARARTPAPFSTGSCDFDLTGAKADTVFFVLGALDEYLGRRIVEDDDRVEGFYCDEASTAALFRRYIVRLAEEQGLDPVVRDEVVQECLISYRSKPIVDHLNSCYQYQASSASLEQAPDGSYRRTASASLSMQLFLRSGQNASTGRGLSDEVFHRRRALAYVAGAWVRYGRGSDFIFANAQGKTRLIAQLLSYLGCRDVRLESDFGRIPQTNVVHFQPTDEVSEWLQRVW